MVLVEPRRPMRTALVGNVMIFPCACASLYMVWFKRLIAKIPHYDRACWAYCAAAVMARCLSASGPCPHRFRGHRPPCPGALFVLVVPTYLPNLMLNYALKTVPATVSSIYTYLQPVLAIAISIGMGLDKPMRTR